MTGRERRGLSASGPVRGRLVAVDGSSPRVAAAAALVARGLAGGAGRAPVSAWDSSGIFTELMAADGVPGLSARTLTLLYAADLAFRLRWQIGPALREGRAVVAAPYVETAKALAVAAGLPRVWLDELFRFAPRPDASYHVTPGRARDVKAGASYVECFVAAALAGPQLLDAARLRKRSADYLGALEREGTATRLPAGRRAAPCRRARR